MGAAPLTPRVSDFPLAVESSPPGVDSDLLLAARSGDAAAFGELCANLEGPLLRQATLLSRDAAQAEDLVQATLVTAWRSLNRYRGGCRLLTWVSGILLNLHRNDRRKGRASALSQLPGEESETVRRRLESLSEPAPGPDLSLELAERAEILQACVARLRPKYRDVVHLRFFVDDSLEAIASALGCPVGTVKSRLAAALGELLEMPELRHVAREDLHL